MKKIWAYLLGEDLVNEQNDGEIIEAITGVAMCAVWLMMIMLALWVFCG